MATQHSGDVTLSGGVYDRENKNTFSCETATFHRTHLDCSRCDNQVLHNRYFQPCDLIGWSLSWMGLQESRRPRHTFWWILASDWPIKGFWHLREWFWVIICLLLIVHLTHAIFTGMPRVVYRIGNTWYWWFTSSCFKRKDRSSEFSETVSTKE